MPLKFEPAHEVYAPIAGNQSHAPTSRSGSFVSAITQSMPSHVGPQIEHGGASAASGGGSTVGST